MDNQFAVGMRVYKPSDKAPDFIKANIEIDVTTFCEWVQMHPNDVGKVRLVIKESREGKYYAALDGYRRDVVPEPKQEAEEDKIPW